MVIVRTLVLLTAASLLSSCISLEGAVSRLESVGTGMKEDGQTVASATVRGAEVVGESVGTSYRGVRDGFQEPDDTAYGPYPRDYANTIRKHMLRFEGVKQPASFVFGEPVKSYLNKGLLLGGDIDWQGWAVDVAIQTKTPFGQTQLDEYVVRMNDGDVVEVVEKAYAGAIRRVSPEKQKPSVPAAPQR